MTLQLLGHPLSSYCWKVMIALHELGLDYELVTLNLGDPQERARLAAVSPFVKMPVLRDGERALSETSIIIDYLDERAGGGPLIPRDGDSAREVRFWDRVFDLYVHNVFFLRLVSERFRPETDRDPFGAEQGRAELRQAYDVLDRHLAGRTWAAGEVFSMADCAAAPALFYADVIEPIGGERAALKAYYGRLRARPSVRRAVDGARPVFHMFPGTPEERERLEAAIAR